MTVIAFAPAVHFESITGAMSTPSLPSAEAILIAATEIGALGPGKATLPLVLAAVVSLVRLVINVYFYAVLLRVILSWFMPYGMRQNPAGDLLVSLTEPLMRPARRLIPAVGGLDRSPIVVLVGLQRLQLALAHLLR